MSTLCQEYELVHQRIGSFLHHTGASKPQVANLALLVWGLLRAQDCRMGRLARQLPVRAGVAAARERMLRLVKNPLIKPAQLYAPVGAYALRRFAGKTLTLIMDATQSNGRLFILSVALAWRGRALPVGWLMLDKQSVSCRFGLQQQLLDRVLDLLPPDTQVLLLGDRDYGTVELVRYCRQHGWHFCLRLKRNRLLRLPDGRTLRLDRLALQPGQRSFYQDVRLPALPEVALSLSCCLSPDAQDDDAWYILSDLPAGSQRLREYAKRMFIDEMFRDFKAQGFRLEASGLWARERVDRLLLGISLAYILALYAGAWAVRNRRRRMAEGYGWRRNSYFLIGVGYVLVALANRLPVPLPPP